MRFFFFQNLLCFAGMDLNIGPISGERLVQFTQMLQPLQELNAGSQSFETGQTSMKSFIDKIRN